VEKPDVDATSMVDWGKLAPDEPEAKVVTTGQLVYPWE
jgi:hypothetical protein